VDHATLIDYCGHNFENKSSAIAMIRDATIEQLTTVVDSIGDDQSLHRVFVMLLLTENDPVCEYEFKYLLENGKTCPVWAKFHSLWPNIGAEPMLVSVAKIIEGHINFLRQFCDDYIYEIEKIKQLLGPRRFLHLGEAQIYKYHLNLID
jgi:hypothetical protein